MKLEYSDIFPESLDPNTIYVSRLYDTSAHMCPSGCGIRVVLPLGKGGWSVIDRSSVSMFPSIHVQTCNSHYWIDEGMIQWASNMTPEQAERYSRLDQLKHRVELHNPSWFQKIADLFKRYI